MSNDIDKDRHSKRRHKTEVKSKRQAKIAKAAGIKVESPHRFAKQHATNCGNSNCVMCGNPRKFFGDKTIQEQRFDEIYKQDVERESLG